jgi:hypothetical protein
MDDLAKGLKQPSKDDCSSQIKINAFNLQGTINLAHYADEESLKTASKTWMT